MTCSNADNLVAWGWDDTWDAAWGELAPAGEPGRVIALNRDHLTLSVASGVIAARWHPQKGETARPAVGDWCAVSRAGPEETGQVRLLLRRRSELVRQAAGKATQPQVLATNIDTVLLVCGLDRSQGMRSIERFVALALDGGTTPVILLNKIDLCDDLDNALLSASDAAPGFEVIPVSATGAQGLDQLAPFLRPGHTVALLGPSGAGKSSLLNALAGEAVAPTGEVRDGDRRGRHTTTGRHLYCLPSGGLVIDTPGLRELAAWITGEGLRLAFEDIEALAARCRFNDCSHDNEPGCAVRQALLDEELDPQRFSRFLELHQEAEAQQRRRDERQRGNSKKRFKDLSQTIRRYNKNYRKKP